MSGKLYCIQPCALKKKHAKLVFSKVKKVQFVYFLNNLKRLTSELLHFFSIIVGNKVWRAFFLIHREEWRTVKRLNGGAGMVDNFFINQTTGLKFIFILFIWKGLKKMDVVFDILSHVLIFVKIKNNYCWTFFRRNFTTF